MTERWVVFDLIGVLAEPSWREITTAADHDWSAYRVGEIPESVFWSADLAAAHRKVLSFRGDRLAYLRSLKARGVRVCVATNFSGEWLDALLARSSSTGIFDARVVSSEIGAAKPDPAFFTEVLRHAPPGSIFVDDQKPNCDAAARAGLIAVLAYPGFPVQAEVDRLLSSAPLPP